MNRRPYEVDTDEDGLTDGEELVFGVNPSAADSDGDGLNDWDEFVVGSDPLEVDTDGDRPFFRRRKPFGIIFSC